MASMADPMVPYAVMRTTTVSGRSSRATLRISMPSVSGSRRSVRTSSKGAARSRSRADSPVGAPSTSNPSARRSLVRKWTMFSSSSTTRMRAGTSLMASPYTDQREGRTGREDDEERGTPARRQLHHERAVEQLDDAVANRQPQPRAFPPPLRREERLEDASHVLARDPGPAVRNRHRDRPLPGLEHAPHGLIALPGVLAVAGLRRHPHGAARRGGLGGVQQDVDEDLLEQRLVGQHL